MARTGSSVDDNAYEAIMLKPTASESGRKSARAEPSMNKEGRKTATTHVMARKRGPAVRRMASRTARATGRPFSRSCWMASMATVASSTRMPTAKASPPKVMRLMVWPQSQRPSTASSSASGMLTTTTSVLRASRRKTKTIRPVSTAPSKASRKRSSMARLTIGLWSISYVTLMSAGTAAWKTARFSFTRPTTESVDASERLVTGM